MKFEVKVLGSSSALPGQGRHPSAQILNAHDQLYLIDCGEGTQLRMHRFGVKRGKIDHIFITHLHGDHVFGLVPLLSSYALYKREEPLHVYGPSPIDEFIQVQLDCMGAVLPYELIIHELTHSGKEIIMEDAKITVSAFPLVHRVPTFGYIFREQPKPPHIVPEKLKEHGIELSQIRGVKERQFVMNEKGEKIPTEKLTTPSDPPRSYAYLTDTAYDPDFSDHIQEVNLLYHEATFTHELKERADKTKHSTAKEAAMLAKKAHAEKLLIGHFSTRYTDLSELLSEAREVFPNSHIAIEGEDFLIESND